MNLYLSLGRIWTGTQNDAKEAQGGKDFAYVDVPTDKPGLIAFLNELPTKFPDMFRLGDVEVLAPTAPLRAPSDSPGVMVDEADLTLPTPKIVSPASIKPGDCPACHRSERVARMTNQADAVLGILADLDDVQDMNALVRIIEKVRERKEAIAAPKAA